MTFFTTPLYQKDISGDGKKKKEDVRNDTDKTKSNIHHSSSYSLNSAYDATKQQFVAMQLPTL